MTRKVTKREILWVPEDVPLRPLARLGQEIRDFREILGQNWGGVGELREPDWALVLTGLPGGDGGKVGVEGGPPGACRSPIHTLWVPACMSSQFPVWMMFWVPSVSGCAWPRQSRVPYLSPAISAALNGVVRGSEESGRGAVLGIMGQVP
jgi:hypothetical protein